MKTLGDDIFEPGILDRARGCLMGQFIGDAFGSQVEFMSATQIIKKYPFGLKEMQNGGKHNSLAGQLTDDSEMAVMLIDSLLKNGSYNPIETLGNYVHWLDSHPKDIGATTLHSLEDAKEELIKTSRTKDLLHYLQTKPLSNSQANGAMMRISPLAIFGSSCDLDTLTNWAVQDANLTHTNKICHDANVAYVVAVHTAINTGDPLQSYEKAIKWSIDNKASQEIIDTMIKAEAELPNEYYRQMGWVLIAMQNAFYYLCNPASVEEVIIKTAHAGGDCDTNCCIAGALIGAVNGVSSMPQSWVQTILDCKPDKNNANCHKPRPKEFWANSALEWVDKLLAIGYIASKKQ